VGRKWDKGGVPLSIRKAGVIGGGTTGSGIVVAYLDTGASVVLVEASQEALERSVGTIRMIFAGRVKRGIMTMEEAMAVGEWWHQQPP